MPLMRIALSYELNHKMADVFQYHNNSHMIVFPWKTPEDSFYVILRKTLDVGGRMIGSSENFQRIINLISLAGSKSYEILYVFTTLSMLECIPYFYCMAR